LGSRDERDSEGGIEMRWDLLIEDKNGNTRRIPLDHDYDTEDEAAKEAESIADWEYTEDDMAWGIVKGE